MTESLMLHRVLKAPRAKVYAAWTDPAHMVHWFMPKPHALSDIVVELRPGGRFESVMHVDGKTTPSLGCVLDAVPGERFVWTNLMTAEFQPVAEPGLGFTATIALGDHPEGTDYRVTLRHRTEEEAARHEAMGFSTGWGIVAGQLEAYAAAMPD
jgi:uncharacterized protein YndB with AHSA1/START domain